MIRILAGDAGGTNTRLALFRSEGERLVEEARASLKSREHASLEEPAAAFLAAHGSADRACIGVAGPVVGGVCRATNLPWVVDERALARRLGVARTAIMNDLEATAWAIPALAATGLAVLQEGAAEARGNQAVVAAGTGFGAAGLYFDGHRHHPFASEGGHADFAPRSEVEFDLLRRLAREHGRVSVERVVSGPGLFAVYRFLRDGGGSKEDATVAREIEEGDPGAAISRAALAGRSELCRAALDLFVSLYGAEAGNVALRTMATGGVYLAGGIAPRILPALAGGGFIRAFNDKGRMRGLLEAVPVRVIVDDRAALLGATRRALAEP